jgi:NADPH:quinone reductase-like Zn-dependent oxidoreductase
MKAIVQDRYGSADVLELRDIPDPVVGDEDVLVRVRAAGCGPDVWHLMTGLPYFVRLTPGFHKLRAGVRGRDVAGLVEAVGAKVTGFHGGDEVLGIVEGSFAELAIGRPDKLVRKPARLSFEEAAAVSDGALAALMTFRRANLRKGQRILVYGASGSCGTAGVQLARYFGAHVTAVCNTKNVELVRSLGADEVIDYLQEDFTKNGETYDIVYDAVGKHSFRRCRRSLKPGGIYAATDLGFMWHVPLLALLTKWIGDRNVSFEVTRSTKADVVFLKELIETGNYRAVVDRRYPLEDVVEATRYVETQQKTGNVVLTVSDGRA